MSVKYLPVCKSIYNCSFAQIFFFNILVFLCGFKKKIYICIRNDIGYAGIEAESWGARMKRSKGNGVKVSDCPAAVSSFIVFPAMTPLPFVVV